MYYRAYAGGNPLDFFSGAEDQFRRYAPITAIIGVLMAGAGWSFFKGRGADILVFGGGLMAAISAYFMYLSFAAPQDAPVKGPLEGLFPNLKNDLRTISGTKQQPTKSNVSPIPTQPTGIQQLKNNIVKVPGAPPCKLVNVPGQSKKVLRCGKHIS